MNWTKPEWWQIAGFVLIYFMVGSVVAAIDWRCGIAHGIIEDPQREVHYSRRKSEARKRSDAQFWIVWPLFLWPIWLTVVFIFGIGAFWWKVVIEPIKGKDDG